MNKYELQKLFEAWVSAEKRDPLTIKLMGQLLYHAQKFFDIEADLPIREQISRLEKEMKSAAQRLEFEEAAEIRDRIRELRELQVFS